jgi:hypothetical protein
MRNLIWFSVMLTSFFAGTNPSNAQWVQTNGPYGGGVLCFATSGTNLFVGTYGGVFLSANNGTSWTAVNSGLTDLIVFSLAVSDANLFAGTNSGVSRRSLAEMITLVRIQSPCLPAQFSLYQNYPNSFNPSTSITYQLPINTFVVLKVYDALGKEIEILVNKLQSAGYHSITFSAGNLPSGVYFYRLQAGTYTDTKKLLVLK